MNIYIHVNVDIHVHYQHLQSHVHMRTFGILHYINRDFMIILHISYFEMTKIQTNNLKFTLTISLNVYFYMYMYINTERLSLNQ